MAKWKRWSREFLDPDPLGGFQSGYARQFSYKEAFRVYLGGFIVAELKYTIDETRTILSDLHPWLIKNHFYTIPELTAEPIHQYHLIFIYRLDEGQFGYAIRCMPDRNIQNTGSSWQETFELEMIGLTPQSAIAHEFTHACLICINALHDKFISMFQPNENS